MFDTPYSLMIQAKKSLNNSSSPTPSNSPSTSLWAAQPSEAPGKPRDGLGQNGGFEPAYLTTPPKTAHSSSSNYHFDKTSFVEDSQMSATVLSATNTHPVIPFGHISLVGASEPLLGEASWGLPQAYGSLTDYQQASQKWSQSASMQLSPSVHRSPAVNDHQAVNRRAKRKQDEPHSPTEKSVEARIITQDFEKSNFGNDFSHMFAKWGILPQKMVQNIEDPLQGYPKLQHLHDVKRRHNAAYSFGAVGLRTPTKNIAQQIQDFSTAGAQFDVVVLHGCTDQWSSTLFQTLHIDLITPRPSLLFFWIPSNRIAEGRDLMESWGFRRGEDIVYMIDSVESVYAPQQRSWGRSADVFQSTTWHCLMGLKGTLRRTSDTNLINCNVDTDVIIETAQQQANIVPEQIYRLIDNFTSMRRKLHIVPFDAPMKLPVRHQRGWVMCGPSVLPYNRFDPSNFRQRSMVPVHPEADLLRPQTPPARQ